MPDIYLSLTETDTDYVLAVRVIGSKDILDCELFPKADHSYLDMASKSYQFEREVIG